MKKESCLQARSKGIVGLSPEIKLQECTLKYITVNAGLLKNSGKALTRKPVKTQSLFFTSFTERYCLTFPSLLSIQTLSLTRTDS